MRCTQDFVYVVKYARYLHFRTKFQIDAINYWGVSSREDDPGCTSRMSLKVNWNKYKYSIYLHDCPILL